MGRAGHIGFLTAGRQRDFCEADEWIAPARVAGGLKANLEIYVGSSIREPDQGVVLRNADGDGVFNPTDPFRPPVQQDVPLRGTGAHIAAADNRTGVLTIRLSDGRSLRYSSRSNTFLPPRR